MNFPVRKTLPYLAALALVTAAPAQTMGPEVQELSLERQLALSTTLGTASLNVPADKLQAVTSGALEVRERLIYNPGGATLTSTIFAVQTGSPLPTPINADLSSQILGVYTLSVEKLYSTTKPKGALAFVGTVTGASGNGVLGDMMGAPFVVSLGYTQAEDGKSTVSDVVHVMAGRVVAYTKDAAGTLTIPKPTTPPTEAEGPQISVVAPTNTVDRQIVLDASGTTDASGTSLSFVWKNVNKSSVILNPNTAIATVQFTEGLGDYIFELTVTNGNGTKATKTVTVSYWGR